MSFHFDLGMFLQVVTVAMSGALLKMLFGVEHRLTAVETKLELLDRE